MGTLATPLRDAGRLKDAAPIEPALTAPVPPQPVVFAPLTVESLPALIVEKMPAPVSWRHSIHRDAAGAMVEVISVPIEAAP